MGAARRVLRSTSSLFVLNAATMASTAAAGVAVARALGPDALGDLSFSLGVGTILYIATDLGLADLLLRETSRDEAGAGGLARSISRMKLLGVGLALALVPPLLGALSYGPDLVLLAVLVASGFGLSSMARVPRARLRGSLRPEREVPPALLFSLAILAGAGAVVLGAPLAALGAGYAAAGALEWVCAAALAKGVARGSPPLPSVLARRDVLRLSVPFGVVTLFTVAISRMDAMLLHGLKDASAAGGYAALAALVSLASFVPATLVAGVFPAFSALHGNPETRRALDQTLEDVFRILLALQAGVVLVLVFSGDLFLRLLYGASFDGLKLPLQILALGQALGAGAYLLIVYLQTGSGARLAARIYGGAAAVNLLLNLALIPWLGVTGAALAMLATLAFILVAALLLLRRVYDARRLARAARNVAGAAAAGALAGVAGAWVGLPQALQALAALSVFLAGAVFLRLLRMDDLSSVGKTDG